MLDEQGGKSARGETASLVIEVWTNELFAFNKAGIMIPYLVKVINYDIHILAAPWGALLFTDSKEMLPLDLWYQNTCEWMNCFICSCLFSFTVNETKKKCPWLFSELYFSIWVLIQMHGLFYCSRVPLLTLGKFSFFQLPFNLSFFFPLPKFFVFGLPNCFFVLFCFYLPAAFSHFH